MHHRRVNRGTAAIVLPRGRARSSIPRWVEWIFLLDCNNEAAFVFPCSFWANVALLVSEGDLLCYPRLGANDFMIPRGMDIQDMRGEWAVLGLLSTLWLGQEMAWCGLYAHLLLHLKVAEN